MAEDSGAFKTNSANSRQISALCDDPVTALQRSLTGQGNVLSHPVWHSNLVLFNKRPRVVAVF
jgi:hypothetical protein